MASLNNAAADAMAPEPDENDYRCPICLEIMVDPVVAADGFSYEREQIQRWLASGKRTSPKTNLRLNSTNLFPNRYLQQRIKEYQEHQEKLKAR